MDFEELLTEVGNFGRYQKIRIILLSFLTLPTVLHTYIQTFTAAKSDHWCQSWKAEDCSAFNLTTMECESFKRELTIPIAIGSSSEGTVYMQCEKYNVSGLNLETAVTRGQNNLIPLETIPCDEGWIFDKTTFPSSVVYDLVCGKDYLPNFAQSGYFAGSLIGTLAAGLASDLFGRRKALLLILALTSIVGLAISFSPNFITYMVLRFLTAISVQGSCSVCYTLGNELVIPSKRVIVMAILLVSSGFAYVMLSGIAKFMSSWRMLHFTVAMYVIILFIVSWFLVPESPRWLLACDRSSDAEVVLRKMAKGNGKQLTDDFTTKVSNTTANVKKTNEIMGNMRNVIRSRIGIFLGITLSIMWMVASLTFYGHTLNTSSFEIDPYLSLAFFGAIETPAYFSGMFLTGHLGRKNIVFASFILGGICCCLIPVIALPLWKVLVAVAGKFFVAVSYGTVTLWTIEMVPTSLRNRLIGFFSISSRIGGIIAPMLLILEDIWHGLPVLVFGLLSFAAGFLCLLLPETTGISLPVTMKDTKELYRLRKTSKCQKRDTQADESDMGYCNKAMQEDATEDKS